MASFADLDEAEERVNVAVQAAFRTYVRQLSGGVFRDQPRVDVSVWPIEAWPRLVTDTVVPVVRDVFIEEAIKAGAGSSASSLAQTFITSLQPLIENTHIPDRVLQLTTELAASPEYQQDPEEASESFLSGLSGLMVGALAVFAINAANQAVNTAVFEAGRVLQTLQPQRRVMKTWTAHHDEKTRLTHRIADGQQIPLGEAFNVGGFPLRFPRDPFGPPGEVMNCRCRLNLGVEDE